MLELIRQVEIHSMENESSPSILSFLPASILLGAFGWAGIITVVLLTTPQGGTRWAFFFFGIIAITATFLPVMAYLNLRFPSDPPVSHWVIVRQSLWIGIYVPTLAWLQIGRVLTLPMALLFAAGLILIEVLLRLRERSQFKS